MNNHPIVKTDILELVEILRTIIGESRYAGYPCTLVRLSGCNLDCEYCDTDYARGDFTFEEHIFDTAHKIKDDWVLITGGEPLLQEAIYEFMGLLQNRKKEIVLETNGSIDISKVPKDVRKIVDIKTPSSKMSKSFNEKNIDYLSKNDEVKFLIADDDDFRFAMKKIDNYQLLDRCDVSFSPVWDTINAKELSEAILETKKPIRLNLQHHKIIGIK